MNTFNKKSFHAAVLAGLAAVAAVPLYAMKCYNDRFLTVYAKEDKDDMSMGEVMDAIKEKFGEIGTQMKKQGDNTEKAIEDLRKEGKVYAETVDKLKSTGEETAKLQTEFKGLQAKFLELEQKDALRTKGNDKAEHKSAGQIVAESEQFKRMIESKEFKMSPVEVERKYIMNPTLNDSQPLVPAYRTPGIIEPARKRLYIRDLMPQIPTQSNLIDFCSELLFTNNAAPQGSTTSPTAVNGEGEAKNLSDITFQLSSSPVITIAHWIGASRQILSDATALAGYINSRLEYGLKLEEEDELLNATGISGKLNGIRNQQTAFTAAGSNDQNLDALLRAMNQSRLSFYEPTATILNPTNWTGILLLKDTQGRYLFGDPHGMTQPAIWGLPVVPTASMPQGAFTVGNFDMACAIYDRENVNIRVSDQHADFFTRNLVAILCEERLALVIYRTAAIIGGTLPVNP